MKRKGLILAVFTIVFILIASLLWLYSDSNDYVLKINGEAVDADEFKAYLAWEMSYMEVRNKQNGNGTIDWEELDELEGVPNKDIAKDAAKDLIINTKTLTQEARKRKIELTDEEIQKLNSQVDSTFEFLALNGLSKEDFLRIMKENALIEKLALSLAPEEEKTVFDSRHILFNTQGMTDAEKADVKKKAEAVLARIKNGEDFAKLAGEYTDDPGSKSTGGLYTGISVGSFVKPYEDAVFAVADGEVYPELVESDYGYHIVKREKVETKNEKPTIITDDIYNDFMQKDRKSVV